MDNRVSSLGQGPGLAFKRNTSSFPPGSLAELEEWTGKPSWHGELTFQQWNTVGWAITDDGTLCIRPWKGDAGETGPSGPSSSSSNAPWYDQRSNIKKVESIGTIVLNASSVYLFYGSNLTDLTGLAGWKVSNVTNTDAMFQHCRNLTDLTGLAGWDVPSVTKMTRMFANCRSLTDLTALKDWKVSNVTDMSIMFFGCSSLTDATALAYWNVSKVTSMRTMFYGCSKLQKIGIPSISNGGRKLVENAKNANLTTVLPSIVSEDGSMGPYTWDGLKSAMTTNPSAFQEGTVWVRANEEAAQ